MRCGNGLQKKPHSKGDKHPNFEITGEDNSIEFMTKAKKVSASLGPVDYIAEDSARGPI
jgi:hypothetical protein